MGSLNRSSKERIVSLSSRWFIKRIDLDGSFRFSGHCSGSGDSTSCAHSSTQDTQNDNKGKDTSSQTSGKGSRDSTSTTTIQTDNTRDTSANLGLIVGECVVQVGQRASVGDWFGLGVLVDPFASRLRLNEFTEGNVDTDSRFWSYVLGVATIRARSN